MQNDCNGHRCIVDATQSEVEGKGKPGWEPVKCLECESQFDESYEEHCCMEIHSLVSDLFT